MIEEGDKVLVAVSGGPDSLSLLHVLNELKYPICVAHVNHGLRENADIDEAFVRDFCQEKNIPFFAKKVNLKEMQDKMTVEEAGRKIRYDFFYEVMEKEGCTKLATAHNSNDNAETVIMNLIRGSGISGLKGIEPMRGNLIRPLIDISRAEIEEYCKMNNLNPRIDKTNFENDCSRNKIRNIMLPYIKKEFNPNIIQTIDRLSKVASETENYLHKETIEAFQELKIEETCGKIILDLKKFNKYEVM